MLQITPGMMAIMLTCFRVKVVHIRLPSCIAPEEEKEIELWRPPRIEKGMLDMCAATGGEHSKHPFSLNSVHIKLREVRTKA